MNEVNEIKSIIEKLIKDGKPEKITNKEFNSLLTFTNNKVKHNNDSRKNNEKKPLIYWMSKQLLLWRSRVRYQLHVEYYSDILDASLAEPGISTEYPGILTRDVNLVNLEKSIKLTLLNPKSNWKDQCGAIELAMLCNLINLLPEIKILLKSNSDNDVKKIGLYALVILGKTKWNEIYSVFYSIVDDWIARDILYYYCEMNPDEVDSKILIGLLKSEEDDNNILGHIQLYVDHYDTVLDFSNKIETLISNRVFSWFESKRVANALLEIGDIKFIRKVWNYENIGIAVSLKLCWTTDKKYLSLLKEKFDEAEDLTVKAFILVAIASIEGPDIIEQYFTDDNWELRMGAIWASVNHKKYHEEILRLQIDSVIDVKNAALFVSIIWDKISGEILDTAITALFRGHGSNIPLLEEYYNKENIPIPMLIEHHNYLFNKPIKSIDEILRIYNSKPYLLIEWDQLTENETANITDWPPIDPSKDHFILGSLIAALIGGKANQIKLEEIFIDSTTMDEKYTSYSLLAICGKPKTLAGATIAKSLIYSKNENNNLNETEKIILFDQLLLGKDDEHIVSKVLKYGKNNLLSDGYISSRVIRTFNLNHSTNSSILQILGMRGIDSDIPFLKDIILLLNPSDLNASNDLNNPERFLYLENELLRHKFTEYLKLLSDNIAIPYLYILSSDGSDKVSTTAIALLIQRKHGDKHINQSLVKKINDTSKENQSILLEAAGESEDMTFIPVLKKLWIEYNGFLSHLTTIYFNLMKCVNANNIPLLFYTAKDPEEVNWFFSENLDFDYNENKKSEAVRMVAQALLAKADNKSIKDINSKKILIQFQIEQEFDGYSSNIIDKDMFEKIASYLRVMFIDKEVGSIVAEIEEEPTGEIVNALFQNEDRIAFIARWI